MDTKKTPNYSNKKNKDLEASNLIEGSSISPASRNMTVQVMIRLGNALISGVEYFFFLNVFPLSQVSFRSNSDYDLNQMGSFLCHVNNILRVDAEENLWVILKTNTGKTEHPWSKEIICRSPITIHSKDDSCFF